MSKVDTAKLKERYEKIRKELQEQLKRERVQRRKQKDKDDAAVNWLSVKWSYRLWKTAI